MIDSQDNCESVAIDIDINPLDPVPSETDVIDMKEELIDDDDDDCLTVNVGNADDCCLIVDGISLTASIST